VRVLTVEETQAWLLTRQLQFRPATAWGLDHRLELPHCHRIWFGTPRDAKRQMSLAHLLSDWFGCAASLLVVNVVALFGPHELDAFLFLRRCYGADRWVDKVPGGATPGHLFTSAFPESRRQVREFMTVMLAYVFQGYLVQDDGRDLIWLADEVIDVYSPDLERIHLVKGIIDQLGLEMFGAESPITH
jgi:hypothetical protein